MKSSQKVLKVIKILKIVSLIAFICAIVSCVSCALGSVFVGVFGKNEEFLRLLTSYGIEFNYNTYLCICISGAVECAFLIPIYYFAKKFFTNVLDKGEIYDKNNVKSMQKLGWIHIFLSISCSLVIAILVTCFKVDIAFSNSSTIILGVMYLLFSFFVEYGADIKKENEIIKNEIEQFDNKQE